MRVFIYSHHRGQKDSMRKMNAELFGQKKGQLDPSLALQWGGENDNSGIVTLLSNIKKIRPNENLAQFNAAGKRMTFLLLLKS